MITPSGNFRVFLAIEPVDFRKGMDGLTGYVAAQFDLDPFDGAIYVFRSRGADHARRTDAPQTEPASEFVPPWPPAS